MPATTIQPRIDKRLTIRPVLVKGSAAEPEHGLIASRTRNHRTTGQPVVDVIVATCYGPSPARRITVPTAWIRTLSPIDLNDSWLDKLVAQSIIGKLKAKQLRAARTKALKPTTMKRKGIDRCEHYDLSSRTRCDIGKGKITRDWIRAQGYRPPDTEEEAATIADYCDDPLRHAPTTPDKAQPRFTVPDGCYTY